MGRNDERRITTGAVNSTNSATVSISRTNDDFNRVCTHINHGGYPLFFVVGKNRQTINSCAGCCCCCCWCQKEKGRAARKLYRPHPIPGTRGSCGFYTVQTTHYQFILGRRKKEKRRSQGDAKYSTDTFEKQNRTRINYLNWSVFFSYFFVVHYVSLWWYV